MNDLSSYLLDIMFNCIEAKSKNIKLFINEDVNNNILKICIEDDGIGMSDDQIKKVTDPFYTSRKTRKVGLGIPFYKELCEQCGGTFHIKSKENIGTTITSSFKYDSIDLPDMGDIQDTICAITLNQNIDLFYQHIYQDKEFTFDTKKVKEIIENIPINDPHVLLWIKDYIKAEISKLR